MSPYKRTLRAPWKGLLALTRLVNRFKCILEGAVIGKGSVIEGRVYVRIDGTGGIRAGRGLHVTGGYCRNRISRDEASSLCTQGEGRIVIGEGVGISSSCLWARKEIVLGDRTQVGAGCIILDHDAHSLDPRVRSSSPEADYGGTSCAPVRIGDDVLLGAKTMVLKGVTIGKGSVVGAGSVVTGDIPEGEVWAGNPCRFIRKISYDV